MMKEAIALLVEGHDLSREMARAAMDAIMSGQASQVQICAFLVAMRIKGESPAELAGCVDSMRAAATPVRPARTGLVDTCGTGGDGGQTFNVSTAVAFVAAGMGLPVAKHGNRSISSKCGSADVLEELGVNIQLRPEEIASCIDEAGIGFLYAPNLHLSTRHSMPVRLDLGLRTVFNLLGPLSSPAGVQRQLIGAFSPDVAQKMARALSLLGTEHVMVVHSFDGLDEISPSGTTQVYEVKGHAVSEFRIEPEDAGVARYPRALLAGGDAAHNAWLIEELLAGQPGPRTEAVVLNAAAVAVVGGAADGLMEGARLARESLASGAAHAALRRLREYSNARTVEVVQ